MKYFSAGPLRHLFQNTQADDADLWRLEPPGVRSHEWRHLLPALPRAVELRLAQDCREPCAIPATALLHDRLRTPDIPWVAAVPGSHSS